MNKSKNVHKMYTITVANRKGGVGKTTTGFALACGLPYVLSPKYDEDGNSANRVLLIDMDSQCSLSRQIVQDYLGTEEFCQQNGFKTVRDFLSCEPTADNLLSCIGCANGMDIILGSDALELSVSDFSQDESLLRERLSILSEFYDFCIIDTNPAQNLLQYACLRAADIVLPCSGVQTEEMIGLNSLLKDIESLWDKYEQDIMIPYIVIRCSDNTSMEKEWVKEYLDEITEINPWFIRWDPAHINSCYRTGHSIYGKSKGDVARSYAALCVKIAYGICHKNLNPSAPKLFRTFIEEENSNGL